MDDPLLEWNRLNIENAEQDFVTAIYQSMTETSPVVDKFSLWLLAGSGATAALLISQIDTILPSLTEIGFKLSLLALVGSALCGFIAKYKALRCEIQNVMTKKMVELVAPIFERHEAQEIEIEDHAKERGIELNTNIDYSKVIEEFSRPFPWWAKYLIKNKIDTSNGDRQIGHHIGILAYTSQIRWTFYQACLYVLFILMATWYATAI